MTAVRFLLRLLFFPMGASILLLTAAFEMLYDYPDWNFWKKFNAPFLEAMWLL